LFRPADPYYHALMKAMKTALVALLLSSPALFAADPPRKEISGGGIRATINLPDPKNGYYTSTRFDWAGQIFSLEYGGHNYYGPWYTQRREGVRDFIYEGNEIVVGGPSSATGPAEEFSVLGYDDAQPGGTFVKIGIGALKKTDTTAYDRYKFYENADPGKWDIKSGPNFIEFTQTLNGPNGYAYVYRKTIRLATDKPEMTLEHSLKNTGTKAITGTVYNHNFLTIDQKPASPGYTIALPYELKVARPPDAAVMEVQGNKIIYKKTLVDQDRGSQQFTGWSTTDPKDNGWSIESPVGAGMRVQGDHPMLRIGLFAIRSVVALEPYTQLNIEPGQEFSWNYTYDYYSVKK
jgi:hypothetical protein